MIPHPKNLEITISIIIGLILWNPIKTYEHFPINQTTLKFSFSRKIDKKKFLRIKIKSLPYSIGKFLRQGLNFNVNLTPSQVNVSPTHDFLHCAYFTLKKHNKKKSGKKKHDQILKIKKHQTQTTIQKKEKVFIKLCQWQEIAAWLVSQPALLSAALLAAPLVISLP